MKFKVLLLIYIFINSCNGLREKKENTSNAKEVVVLGSILNSYQSIKPLAVSNDSSGLEKKYRIVAYYNGDCGVCYLQLFKWKKMVQKFASFDVDFKFILSGNSSAVIKANLEEIGFPLEVVYHDQKDEFGKAHTFFLDRGYKNSAVLLNKKGEILLIGNPTISTDIMNNYLKFLKN
ncbi:MULTISPECIES: hypothetical protein [Flavobacteriaceae]|uniref:hypothetical protein n=1 Tax=Flavobacteriaceae TaxID=49546 RepID=UPI00387B98A5